MVPDVVLLVEKKDAVFSSSEEDSKSKRVQRRPFFFLQLLRVFTKTRIMQGFWCLWRVEHNEVSSGLRGQGW